MTTYSLHPGIILTEIVRNMFLANIAVIKVVVPAAAGLILKNVVDGAQTTICCAVDEALATESGKYYRYRTSLQ